MRIRILGAVAFVGLLAQFEAESPLKIMTCVPDTLGSESFRAHQTWSYSAGLLKQPASSSIDCLTVSGDVLSGQGSPLFEMLPCNSTNAQNQTWELLGTGQIALSNGAGIMTPAGPCGTADCCIDIAGRSTASGSEAQLWACVANASTNDNERFEWLDYGAVVGVQSGLCLDAGGDGKVVSTCDMLPYKHSTFCNHSLTPYQRAAALVAGSNLTNQIDNLGIPALGYTSEGVVPPTFHEALHGVCCAGTKKYTNKETGYTSTGSPTSFPHALALGATFNRSLWGMVGEVVGIESRALRNENGQGCRGAFFTPNVNLYRDPRWGRGMEVPGEDPTVGGEYGREFVHAMQARNRTSYQQRAMCMVKHWLAYDIEGLAGVPDPDYADRSSFNAIVSKQGMAEYYLPAFHSTIQSGQASGVMCSTNAINGLDACMNPLYLQGFLRDRFNFTGAVVTDGNSCGNANCLKAVEYHNASCTASCPALTNDRCPVECKATAAKLCLEAGTDIELGSTLTGYSAAAVAEGQLSASTIATSNTRLYANMIRAGLFDSSPDDVLGAADVDTERARQLAFEAATSAMVLLKNDGGVLPLKGGRPNDSNGVKERRTRRRSSGGGGGGGGAAAVPLKIALVGPHLNSTTDLLSSLAYTEDRSKGPPFQTIEAAFKARGAAQLGVFTISGIAHGCDIISGCQADTTDLPSVTAAVKGADVVVAFVGLHPSSGAREYPGFGTACAESEARDRTDINLCGMQTAVLEAAKAGASGKPLVVVMINGGTVSISWIKANADAILNAWYPGQSGGDAVAAVVFGDRAPGGRLPITIYDNSVVSKRNITDMNLRSNGGLTYMHYAGTPLYPFGFGLSYTTWSCTSTHTAATTHTTAAAAAANDDARNSVNSVLNSTTGKLAADYAAYFSAAAAGNSPRSNNAGGAASYTPAHTVRVGVTNTGTRTSSVVVQVFAVLDSQLPAGALTPPRKQLVGFERAEAVEPGVQREVTVAITPNALCRVDSDGNQWAEPSSWTLMSSVDGVTFANTSFVIHGGRQQVLSWPTQYDASNT